MFLLLVIIFVSACTAAPEATRTENIYVPEPLKIAYDETVFGIELISGKILLSPTQASEALQPAEVTQEQEQEEPSSADVVPELETPEPETQNVETPKPVMPRADGSLIALTFDDGPSLEITPQIIALLEKYEARATFCVIGYVLERNMNIGKMIFESGCELVGHSWGHSDLTKLEPEAIEEQLLSTNALIEEITGSAPVFYRPPYGAVNDKVREVSENLGFSLLMWSIDPKDWKEKDAEVTYEHILERVTDGSVILCHDIYESTLEMVEMLLDELTERGYRFVTVSELFAGTEVLPGEIYRAVK